MFYLTYRPRTISELDHTDAKRKIARTLASRDIPHAILLVGPKGTGKTSTARIIAKSINCLQRKPDDEGTIVEPCNACSSCRSIDGGNAPDVVEMDAASNRGIEEVKQLIRESAFAPMNSAFRVYIIDEAHMITTEGFNALLKTLEEPPRSVVFVLATTNEEKIPKTIISRCLRIEFGRATDADLGHMLRRIARHEGLSLSDGLIGLIIRAADYSFRDASRILEELVTQGKLDEEEAATYLGMRAQGRSAEGLLHMLGSTDHAAAMDWITAYAAGGGNVQFVIEETLRSLQALLRKKSLSGVSEQSVPNATHQLTLREISHLIRLFHEAYAMMRTTPIESLPLELVVTEFYNEKLKKESTKV